MSLLDNNESATTITIWSCDYCGGGSFETYSGAKAHETICNMNPIVAAAAATCASRKTSTATVAAAAANKPVPKTKNDEGAAPRRTPADAAFGVGYIVYKEFNGTWRRGVVAEVNEGMCDGGNDRRVVYDDLEGQEYISPKGLEILRAQANIYNARNNYRLYTSFPNDILDELPGEFKETFGEGGFVRVGNDSNAAWVPVIVVGPFDVKPNPKMKKWMMMFKKWKDEASVLLHLVVWYHGRKKPTMSLVHPRDLTSYRSGVKEGYGKVDERLQKKIDKGAKLTNKEASLIKFIEMMKLDKELRIAAMESPITAANASAASKHPQLDSRKPAAAQTADSATKGQQNPQTTVPAARCSNANTALPMLASVAEGKTPITLKTSEADSIIQQLGPKHLARASTTSFVEDSRLPARASGTPSAEGQKQANTPQAAIAQSGSSKRKNAPVPLVAQPPPKKSKSDDPVAPTTATKESCTEHITRENNEDTYLLYLSSVTPDKGVHDKMTSQSSTHVDKQGHARAGKLKSCGRSEDDLERQLRADGLGELWNIVAMMRKEKQAAAKAEKEKNDALVRLSSVEQERDNMKNERDHALKAKEDAIRRIKCFDCFSHENALYAFSPCGDLVCSKCKEKYNTFGMPCPKCNREIAGRVRLCTELRGSFDGE